MNCRACGTHNDEGSKFCSSCGGALEGWWLASDGNWYPPDQASAAVSPPAPPTPAPAAPAPTPAPDAPSNGPPAAGWWIASDGNWYPPEQASPAASQPGPTAPASASPSDSRNGTIVAVAAVGAVIFALLALVAVFVVVRHDGGKRWSSSVRSSFISGCKEDEDSSHTAYSSSECACMADYLASHDVSERDVANAGAQSDTLGLSPLLTTKVLAAFDKCT